ncbi:MAG: DUF87 domain-containing protein [Kiritimatiellales bacterium]
MKSSDKPALHKLILSNAKRMQDLGLQHRDDLQFLHRLSQSPLPHAAFKFASKLGRTLDTLEFQQAVHGNETVPNLSADTSIEIGKTVGKGLSYRIRSSDLTTHMVVCGASGSGKTTLIGQIVNALLGELLILLFDHKDEGLRFVNKIQNAVYVPMDRQRWNCLSGTGDQRDYIRFICSQLTKLMALLPVTSNAVQAKLLALCSDRGNLPAVADLSRVFLALAQKELRSSLHTASKGFSDLAVNMGRWADVRQGHWPFDDYLLSVVPLKNCPATFECFYIATIFRQLMDRATSGGHTGSLRQLVVFDEGRGFFGREMEPGSGSGRGNLQAEIFTKSRSYGIGNIIGTQSIFSLQSTAVDNAGIFIALRTNSEQEAKSCCRRLGLDESRYMEFINMDVGTAWVVSPSCRHPLKIWIPFCDLGTYPSETDIASRMNPIWISWDARTVFAPEKSDAEDAIDFRELLGETTPCPSAPVEAETTEPVDPSLQQPNDPAILSEYFAMLRSCEAHPDFGAAAHYKALGWSGGRGNRVKNRLIELGWIEAVRIVSPQGGRPKETLQLTETGKGMNR